MSPGRELKRRLDHITRDTPRQPVIRRDPPQPVLTAVCRGAYSNREWALIRTCPLMQGRPFNADGWPDPCIKVRCLRLHAFRVHVETCIPSQRAP